MVTAQATATPGDGVDPIYNGDTCVEQPSEAVNGVCPWGHYCPVGSASPISCPAGTENKARQQSLLSDCQNCTAGLVPVQKPIVASPSRSLEPHRYTCPNSSTVKATRLCDPSFYCPGHDVVATNLCPTGHKCVGGDAAPVPCVAGEYQDAVGQTSCLDCPRGSFCLEGSSSPSNCVIGHYCPPKTTYATEFPCPNGTYSDRTALKNASMCTPCDPGKACNGTALTEPSGPVAAGYFSGGGAKSATPGYDGWT